ncbi:hypothetical protein ACF0H5_001047 [Mactra antiquata]
MPGTPKRGRGRGAVTRRRAATTAATKDDSTDLKSEQDELETITDDAVEDKEDKDETSDNAKPDTDDTNTEQADKEEVMITESTDLSTEKKEEDMVVDTEEDNKDSMVKENKEESTGEDTATVEDKLTDVGESTGEDKPSVEDSLEVSMETSEIVDNKSDPEKQDETKTLDLESEQNEKNDEPNQEPAIQVVSSPICAGTTAIDEVNKDESGTNITDEKTDQKSDVPCTSNSNSDDKPEKEQLTQVSASEDQTNQATDSKEQSNQVTASKSQTYQATASKEQSNQASASKEQADDSSASKDVPTKVEKVETSKEQPKQVENSKEQSEQATASKEESKQTTTSTVKTEEKEVKGKVNDTPQTVKKSTPTILSPNISKAAEKDDRPFPASLAKVRLLKVNIGPIKQCDLKSDKLHEVLRLNDTFEIKFELRDCKDTTKKHDGVSAQEKIGFVRIPFEIRTPNYLIKVASILGNLHIDGKNMSVTFPDAFNKALEDCKAYMDETNRIRNKQAELKKKQIVVKNVPPNVTEETIRSLFPEATKITLSVEESDKGEKKVGGVLLEYPTEAASIKCFNTNKDVFIEDCQLIISRLVKPPQSSTYRGKSYWFGRGASTSARGRGFNYASKIKAKVGLGSLRGTAKGSFRGSLGGRGFSGRGGSAASRVGVGSARGGIGGGSSRFPKKETRRGNDVSDKAKPSDNRPAIGSSDGQFALSFRIRRARLRNRNRNRGEGPSSGARGGKVSRQIATFKRENPNTSPSFKQPTSHSTSYHDGRPRTSQYRNDTSPYKSPIIKQEPRKSPLLQDRSSRQSSFRDSRQSRSPASSVRSGSYREEQKFSPGRSPQSRHSQQSSRSGQQSARSQKQSPRRGQQSTRPGQQSARQSQQSHRQGQQASRPGQQSSRPGQQSARPGQQSSRPGQQSARPSQQFPNIQDEDPMAMMAFLKSTIEHMEQKFSQPGVSNRNQDRYDDKQTVRSPFSLGDGRGQRSSSQGQGRGRGNAMSRKRAAGNDREFSQEAKRPLLVDDYGSRDTYGYRNTQDSSSGNRRESFSQGYNNDDYRGSNTSNRDRNYGQSASSSFTQSRSSETYGRFNDGRFNDEDYGQSQSDNYTSRGIVQYSSGNSGGGGGGGRARGHGVSGRGRQSQRW